jgi:hypothetical protein
LNRKSLNRNKSKDKIIKEVIPVITKQNKRYKMNESDKLDTGTQYVDDQDISTQTTNNNLEATLIYDIEVKLGTMSNRLMHGSYWFLILDLMFTTKLQLMGLARSARKREDACRESAFTIMSWVMEKGGRVKMADIAKPDYGREEDFTAEYAVRTMATLDTWLEQGVREVLEMVVGKEVQGMEEMLKMVLENHRGLHWESQATKNTVFQ